MRAAAQQRNQPALALARQAGRQGIQPPAGHAGIVQPFKAVGMPQRPVCALGDQPVAGRVRDHWLAARVKGDVKGMQQEDIAALGLAAAQSVRRKGLGWQLPGMRGRQAVEPCARERHDDVRAVWRNGDDWRSRQVAVHASAWRKREQAPQHAVRLQEADAGAALAMPAGFGNEQPAIGQQRHARRVIESLGDDADLGRVLRLSGACQQAGEENRNHNQAAHGWDCSTCRAKAASPHPS